MEYQPPDREAIVIENVLTFITATVIVVLVGWGIYCVGVGIWRLL